MIVWIALGIVGWVAVVLFFLWGVLAAAAHADRALEEEHEHRLRRERMRRIK